MSTNTYTSPTSDPTDNWNGTGPNLLTVWSLGVVPIDGDDAIIAGDIAPDPTVAPLLPVTLNSLDTTGLTDPNGFDSAPGNVITPQLTITTALSLGNAAAGPSNSHFFYGAAGAVDGAIFNYPSQLQFGSGTPGVQGTVGINAVFTGDGTNNNAVGTNYGCNIGSGASFVSGAYNNGQVNGDAAFTLGSFNYGYSGVVTGDCTCDGGSTQGGVVGGDCILGITAGDTSTMNQNTGAATVGGTLTCNYNTQFQDGTVTGAVIMNNAAQFTGGTALATCTFNGTSQWTGGTALATCTFNGTSQWTGGTALATCTFNGTSQWTGGNCNGSVNWNSTGTISATAAIISIGTQGNANTFTATVPVTIDFGASDGESTSGIYIADDVDFTASTAQVSAQIGTQLVDVYPSGGGGGGGGAGRQTMGISI